MAVPDITIVPEQYETFDLTMRLTKDLKDAASSMTPTQQRILVDMYYQVQENRKASANQLLAAKEEPNGFLVMLSAYLMKLERGIIAALDQATNQSEVGRWSKRQTGIGPVIAAGLAAHIDITIAKTPSAIWRYGGLDSTSIWHGREYIKELVESVRKVEVDDWHAFLWICNALTLHPSEVLAQTHEGFTSLSVDAARALTKQLGGNLDAGADILYYGDHVLRLAFEDPAHAYAVAYPALDFDWPALAKQWTKRPWNAQLKVLLWKLGDCFMKFHNHPTCYYGKVYAERKALEVARNTAGAFAEQAQASLTAKRITNKELRTTYESGRLPAGRIELRARRVAVKLFLSHYFEVAYTDHYGTPPSKAYILAHDPEHHTQYIPPPLWDGPLSHRGK